MWFCHVYITAGVRPHEVLTEEGRTNRTYKRHCEPSLQFIVMRAWQSLPNKWRHPYCDRWVLRPTAASRRLAECVGGRRPRLPPF